MPRTVEQAIFARTSTSREGAFAKIESAARLHRRVRRTIRALVQAAVLLSLISLFVLRVPQVEGRSMLPAIAPGNHVMINTLAYGAALGPWVITRSPLRQGDIIAFERRDGDESRTYLKRIVALAGDTISMHDGSVIVNGARVVWPGAVLADHWNMRSSVIPVGAVFVLGDNRGESNDSRSFGPVPQASIIGKALLIIWPIGNIRPI